MLLDESYTELSTSSTQDEAHTRLAQLVTAVTMEEAAAVACVEAAAEVAGGAVAATWAGAE